VADGMGGHAAGEVAATMAVTMVSHAFVGPTSTWSPNVVLPPDAATNLLRAAIQYVNARIFAVAGRDAALRGMGTTRVVALAVAERLPPAHVGDSRGYVIRGRYAQQLTTDLSVENAAQGRTLTAEERDEYERSKHCVTRAVGTQPWVQADLRWFQPQAGDVFL